MASTDADVWQRIERRLLQVQTLPHNVTAPAGRERPRTPAEAVAQPLAAVRSGLVGTPVEEHLLGPRLFLRAVGPANRAFCGEWWFDADVHADLDRAHSRIHFAGSDKAAAMRDMLRELPAASVEWNAMTEFWALESGAGETLVGYTGIGTPQSRQQTGGSGRMLVGGAKQDFFPVKDPFAVRKVRDLVAG